MTVCLSVVSLSPAVRVNFPWLLKLLGRGIVTVKFLLEYLSLGNKRSSEKASPHVCDFSNTCGSKQSICCSIFCVGKS